MILLFTARVSCCCYFFLSVQPFTVLKDLSRIKLQFSSLRAFIASTVNKGFSNKTILDNIFFCIICCGHIQTGNKPSTDYHEQPIN